MPDLLLGWIWGMLKQLEACWGFIADEEEQSVCIINMKTSMPGCVLCCEQALARIGAKNRGHCCRMKPAGSSELSLLHPASPPVTSSLCISRHVKAQHQPRLADPGQRECQISDSASFAGGALLAPLNSTRRIPCGIPGVGWAGAALPQAAPLLLPLLPPSPSRCRGEALLGCSIFSIHGM